MVFAQTECSKKPPCKRNAESKTHLKGFVQGTSRTGVGNRGCGGVVSQLVAPDERVFISLYGLAVGMTLTQIGVVRAAYAGCNAVTRPISGHVVNKFGHRGLSYAGIPLQSAILMLIPLFTSFGPILAVYVLSGLMRAIVIVANAVGLVQDVHENKVQRGLASGIYNAAGDLGNILGPSIGGLIAQATSIGGVFVIGSSGSTMLFLLVIWVVRFTHRR